MVRRVHSSFSRLLDVTTHIRPNEQGATLVSFLIVFLLMASYFVLRPVRDAMASDWTDTEVSMLWNLQFLISAVIVSVYGLLVSRISFKRIVPSVYAFFGMSFLGFYLFIPLLNDPTLAEKGFYLWVSAFSLFHLSVFWSLMASVFSKDQSQRLFAIIAAGSSAGAIVGPFIPAFFADILGFEMLMLIASVGLALVVPLVLTLYKLQATSNQSQESSLTVEAMAGPWWVGFRQVVRNRFLLGIGVFILLYVFIGSFIYFEQKNLLAPYARAERAQILGTIDWLVNTLTFVMAFFVTGRIVTRCGMPITLLLLPVFLIVGLAALAFAPMVIIVMAIQVARRSANYAITRPAREMLFTQVSQEERVKSKPVIDVVVYRGGDAVSGMLFALLSDGLGLGLAAIATIGAAVGMVWAWVAHRLGLVYQREQKQSNSPAPVSQVDAVTATAQHTFNHQPH